jgi:predicted patatin/cPLA2 family phospholipase
MTRDVLVVEGGGLRGAFSAGALAELASDGSLRLDACYATSSGAPSAAYLLTGQAEDAVRIWQDFTSGSQLIAPSRLLLGKSLMDLDRLIDVFRERVRLQVDRLPAEIPLFVSVTNCTTAQAEYLRCSQDNAFALLKATMALPLVYGPTISIGGVPYFDGGLVDSIPLRKALAHEAQRTIVVLTQPRGYRKRPSPQMARMLAVYYRQFPALAAAFAQRFQRYNDCLDEIERLEDLGQINVIRPQTKLPATRLSRDRQDILASLSQGRLEARTWLRGAITTRHPSSHDMLRSEPAHEL